jgi:hypothetical protein
MGEGKKSNIECFECDGKEYKKRILDKVDIDEYNDGYIFVGDLNIVRRIIVEGKVRNVVRINEKRL